MSQDIEWIKAGETLLGLIIRAGFEPAQTSFLTPDDCPQQVGIIVYPAGSEIPRHVHRPMVRAINGTPECLFVRKGRTEITFYDLDRHEVCRRLLAPGDFILLLTGGHGFRQLDDCVLLEMKPGPYPGQGEKERF